MRYRIRENKIIYEFIEPPKDKNLAEEAPEVYKNIDEVIDVVDKLNLSKKVARMKPLIVVKG